MTAVYAEDINLAMALNEFEANKNFNNIPERFPRGGSPLTSEAATKRTLSGFDQISIVSHFVLKPCGMMIIYQKNVVGSDRSQYPTGIND